MDSFQQTHEMGQTVSSLPLHTSGRLEVLRRCMLMAPFDMCHEIIYVELCSGHHQLDAIQSVTIVERRCKGGSNFRRVRHNLSLMVQPALILLVLLEEISAIQELMERLIMFLLLAI